jgi:hypothetical protein
VKGARYKGKVQGTGERVKGEGRRGEGLKVRRGERVKGCLVLK